MNGIFIQAQHARASSSQARRHTLAFNSKSAPRMLRPLRWLFAVLFLAGGAVLGTLNAEPTMVDLGVVRFEAALGVIMLATLLIGILFGGLALTASVILPMRHRWRRERKALIAAAGETGQRTADGANDGGHHDSFRSETTGGGDGLRQ
jgi:lipopolysaccharide assembly protein A